MLNSSSVSFYPLYKCICIVITSEWFQFADIMFWFYICLQSVLHMPDLKNSELLHNFLTVEDFSKCNTTEIRIGMNCQSMS